MSNDLVSQQLSIPYWKTGHMEAFPDKLDSSTLDMRMMEFLPTNPASHQVAASEQQIGLVEPMPNNPGSQNPTELSKPMCQQTKPEVGHLGLQNLSLPNQQVGEMGVVLNSPGSQKILVPSKRKAEVEPMFNIFMPQNPALPNKRLAQMLHSPNSPGLAQSSAPSKKTVSMQSMSTTLVLNSPAPNTRMIRNDSNSSKSVSQRIQTPKSRSSQMQPSANFSTESFEAVRSKMRESLAAALALVCQHQDKDLKEENNSQGEAVIFSQQTQENSQSAEFTSNLAIAVDQVSANTVDALPSKEYCSVDRRNDVQNTPVETSGCEIKGNSTETYNFDGPQFQYNYVLPDEDASFSDNFFVKDDLLQGNGLSWAFDFDMQEPKKGQVPTAEKPTSVHEDGGGDAAKQQSIQSPENLALKIEVELFKLFGGVNKKYKEKGRSLLFNLKDRNNPELRERVMAGGISPERLCSMSAEELASKELSEWRMAKAEELAQMVVLPDSDVDIRWLLKKTHKGDCQIEVEQDDNVSVDISTGTSTLTSIRPQKKETKARPPSEADEIKNKQIIVGEKSRLENEEFSGNLIIPNDGADLMQGMIVDELKDVDFLPQIVSLDEFMESLNSEPPFENLPVDAGQETPLSDKKNSETGNEFVDATNSQDPVDTTLDKADKVDVKQTELAVDVKSGEIPVERKVSPSGCTSMAEHVWEGVLQLNISALVTAIGLFRGGEKTPTKEWPSALEMKGRVRLDAFGKFLQELHMSRSRAVMVLHFSLKDASSENERSTIYEMANSYVSDERLGFAEPTPGVELYLCPPHNRIVDMISKHISKDQIEILKSTNNGLIGVVVWRKAHLSSTISPNSSSLHKRGSKKQHCTSRGHQQKDINVKVNLTSKAQTSFRPPPTDPEPSPDDDDIPPGFGPAASRDEDDLPEFNFSGKISPSMPKFPPQGPGKTPFQPNAQASSRPVSQIRELIHKYGQSETCVTPPRNWQDERGVGLGIQPWNDDEDDDDIPEWRPQVPNPPFQPQPSMHRQPQPHGGNEHLAIAAPQQKMRPLGTQIAMPMHTPNVVKGLQNITPSRHQGGRWVQPNGPHGLQLSSLENRPGAWQHHGMPALRAGHPATNWRQDTPRNRGGF
ncbi:unnamed protein product [Ilex paraguariensis]|uniref:TFIIS central domain-containing protein n=1 Tax=Ilex paraguariensis TaxID=185542 RepID=A0ABC8R662_9AQUA